MKIMNILHLMLLLPLPLPLGSSNKSNGKLCDKFVILSKHDKKQFNNIFDLNLL